MQKLPLLLLGASLFLGGGLSVWFYNLKPSFDRNWELGQEKLPLFSIQGNTLHIKNFRNFSWTGSYAAEPRYETRSFDLNKVNDLDVFISHFSEFQGLAHIFLSFGLNDGQRIVISLESRREQGEVFSPLAGLFRQYEMIYVVGSEEDFVGVRIKFRNETVYRYDTVATPEQAQALLKELGDSINALAQEPQFYNTATHNCTNEITRQIEKITGIHFPSTLKTFLPGYFDDVLYRMHLLSTRDTFEQTKKAARIDNESADPNVSTFSQDLRKPKP